MFRFMRPRKTLLSLSRLPVRLEHRAQQGQVYNVQKVRFRKPPIRVRTILITLLTIYGCVGLYSKLVFDPLNHAAEDALKDIPANEKQEEEDGEDGSIFIPLPGTTRQLPVQAYRGSDPEWQEFIRMSADKQLLARIRNDLAEFVRKVADSNPAIAMRFGKGVTLRRNWLDIDFPISPPPEFERSGVLITDDYIALATMPVDSAVVFRLRRALWPSALAQSFWALAKAQVSTDTRWLAKSLGVETAEPPPDMEKIIAQHVAKQQALAKGNGLPSPAGPQPESQKGKAIVPSPQPEKAGVTGKGVGQPNDEEATPGAEIASAIRGHFITGIVAFRKQFAKTWRPAPAYPPRGSIIVSGLIELETPKGWLVFDIKGHWDPQTKSYDQRSMVLKLRRVQLKRQGPMGGR